MGWREADVYRKQIVYVGVGRENMNVAGGEEIYEDGQWKIE